MVGYVETSDFDVILKEVNTSLSIIQPKLLKKGSQDAVWTSTECNLLENTFDRPFPVSPFTLRHLWIDLRGKITPPPREPSGETKTKSRIDSNISTATEKGKSSGTRQRSSQKSKSKT